MSFAEAPVFEKFRARAVSALLVVLASAALPRAAQGDDAKSESGAKLVEIDQLSKESFPLNDKDPESSVPTDEQAMRRPLQMGYFVMLLTERGDAAMKRKDHDAAVRYYRALVKALPGRAKAYGLLCQAYEAAGDHGKALENCRTALGKTAPTVEDSLRFVHVMVGKTGELSATDIEDVEAVATHIENHMLEFGPKEQAPIVAAQLRCDLAVRLEDQNRLAACSSVLDKLAPNDAKTIAYAFALAAKRQDVSAVERIIERAKRASLPPDAIAGMESVRAARLDAESPLRAFIRKQAVYFAVAILVLALLATALLFRRKRSVLERQTS